MKKDEMKKALTTVLLGTYGLLFLLKEPFFRSWVEANIHTQPAIVAGVFWIAFFFGGPLFLYWLWGEGADS